MANSPSGESMAHRIVRVIEAFDGEHRTLSAADADLIPHVSVALTTATDGASRALRGSTGRHATAQRR